TLFRRTPMADAACEAGERFGTAECGNVSYRTVDDKPQDTALDRVSSRQVAHQCTVQATAAGNDQNVARLRSPERHMDGEIVASTRLDGECSGDQTMRTPVVAIQAGHPAQPTQCVRHN